jgi:hypothetical protein
MLEQPTSQFHLIRVNYFGIFRIGQKDLEEEQRAREAISSGLVYRSDEEVDKSDGEVDESGEELDGKDQELYDQDLEILHKREEDTGRDNVLWNCMGTAEGSGIEVYQEQGSGKSRTTEEIDSCSGALGLDLPPPAKEASHVPWCTAYGS